MPRTPTANVEPAVLAWARGSLGLALPDAAKKIGVKSDRLEAWEKGESQPSVAQLRKAATVYKRPLAVFFLPEPPRGFDALRDFRVLPESGEGPWSPELRVAVRRAQEQQQTAIELYEMLGERLPELDRLSGQQDAEDFGSAVRERLGIKLADQLKWPGSNPHLAFRAWADAVESLGVLIFHARRVGLDEMRGFSLPEPVPVISVNGSDSPRGRLFTMIHELAHLFLHATGVCDVREHSQTTSQNSAIETYCNRVAAAVLMPLNEFRSKALAFGVAGPDWADEHLQHLSEQFSVSREAALRRLLTLGLTTPEIYEQKRQEYLKAYKKLHEKDKEKDGGPGYYRLKVGQLGHAYIDLALETHGQGLINRFELADALDVKVKQVDKLLDELGGRAGAA